MKSNVRYLIFSVRFVTSFVASWSVDQFLPTVVQNSLQLSRFIWKNVICLSKLNYKGNFYWLKSQHLYEESN